MDSSDDTDDLVSALSNAVSPPAQQYASLPSMLPSQPTGMIDPSVVQKVESSNNPNAVSPKGAVGLMQTMPSTLTDPGFGVTPAQNNSPQELQRVGRDYLVAMQNRYQNPVHALAAYNWGPGHVDQWLQNGGDFSQLPHETQGYVAKVLSGGRSPAASQPAPASAPQQISNQRAANDPDAMQLMSALSGGISAKGHGTASVPSQVAPDNSGAISWGSVPLTAAKNIIPSAISTVKNVVTPILHPIDTAEALYHTGAGEAEKIIPGSTQPDKPYADALNNYFANRYGSMEGLKNALATDPVGVAMDASVLFTGGGSLAAKGAGLAGKVGEAVADVGKTMNPLTAVGRGVGAVASPIGAGAADLVGSLGTHTGGMPLKLAAQAGAQGGDAATDFLANMRGNVPVDTVVANAKNALAQMRADRGAAYRSGMADVSQDKSILSFDPVDAAMAKTSAVKNFKGIDISPATADVRNEIGAVIDQWKGLDPVEYHTPEGFDALKQRIGDIRDNLPFNTPQRVVANSAYGAVRSAITQQAPQYAKIMSDYEKGSDLISDIEKTLSLKNGTSVDTSLRKLQSIMRNNVNSNYGQRAALGDALAQSGAPTLPYQLAGQSLNKWAPRGLGAAEAGVPITAALMSGDWKPLLALPFMSPRAMGEAAYYTGKVTSPLRAAAKVGSKTASAVTPTAYTLGDLARPKATGLAGLGDLVPSAP